MKTKLITILLCLFPVFLFGQNYEKEGDDLYAQGKYEQAVKKYNAAISIVGESSAVNNKIANAKKCNNLLAQAQAAEKTAVETNSATDYEQAGKLYAELYDVHALQKYKTKSSQYKQKSIDIPLAKQLAAQAERERLAKEEADRKAKAEAAKKAQQERERIAREKAVMRQQEEAERAKQIKLFKSPGAFKNRTDITHIVIPDGVTKIEVCTFKNCFHLTSIEIPQSVTSIGADAFEGCTRLASVTIPNSVTSIGSYAFSGCCSLTSIAIPNGVTSIGESAFNGCSSLNSVTIPNGVTSIRGMVYSGCCSLTSITIPNGVTSIGDRAFSGCSSLTSVSIPNSVTSIGGMVFNACSSLTSVTIPNSVTSIGEMIFSGCSSLTSVTIPNSVTSIGEKAFWGCFSLTSITIGNSVTSIGENAFKGCSNLEITLPKKFKKVKKEIGLNDCKKVIFTNAAKTNEQKEKGVIDKQQVEQVEYDRLAKAESERKVPDEVNLIAQDSTNNPHSEKDILDMNNTTPFNIIKWKVDYSSNASDAWFSEKSGLTTDSRGWTSGMSESMGWYALHRFNRKQFTCNYLHSSNSLGRDGYGDNIGVKKAVRDRERNTLPIENGYYVLDLRDWQGYKPLYLPYSHEYIESHWNRGMIKFEYR